MFQEKMMAKHDIIEAFGSDEASMEYLLIPLEEKYQDKKILKQKLEESGIMEELLKRHYLSSIVHLVIAYQLTPLEMTLTQLSRHIIKLAFINFMYDIKQLKQPINLKN